MEFELKELFDNLSKCDGTNQKIDLLKKNKDSDLLKNIIEYTVNTQKVYGYIPHPNLIDHAIGELSITNETFNLLDQLEKRQLSGHAARDAVIDHISNMNKDAADIFIKILRKDLRLSIGKSISNKVWSGLIKTFPYMRCSNLSEKIIKGFDFSNGVIAQIKSDGLYSNTNVINGDISFLSRQGSNFDKSLFIDIVNDLELILSPLNGYQLHGEILVYDDSILLDRNAGNGYINSLAKDGEIQENKVIKLVVWDLIPITESKTKNKYNVAYEDRLKQLESIIGDSLQHISVAEYKILYSLEECLDYAKECIELGLEGIVFKHKDLIWEDGTSKRQVKIKKEKNVDLLCTGIENGKDGSKYEGLPAVLNLQSSDGLLKVNVSVKNDELRNLIILDRDLYIGKIYEITGNNISTNKSNDMYSIYLPRMCENTYRIDKSEADSLQRIIEIFEES